jgi:hypothetical protein
MGYDRSSFGSRVPCEKQQEERQEEECRALLRGWAALDFAFEEKPEAKPTMP